MLGKGGSSVGMWTISSLVSRSLLKLHMWLSSSEQFQCFHMRLLNSSFQCPFPLSCFSSLYHELGKLCCMGA